MTTPRQPTDDLLARAEAAWRRGSLPRGPTDDVTERVLSALQAASKQPPGPPSRKHTMRLMVQIAAVLLLAFGGLLYLGSGAWDTRSVAWAQVVEKLNDARTLTYRSTTQTDGQKSPVTAKHLYKVPSHMRLESSNGLIMIMDGSPDKQLFLEPAAKTGFFPNRKPAGKITATYHPGPEVIDLKPANKGTAYAAPDVLDRKPDMRKIEFTGFGKLKHIAADQAEPFGKKNIGGIEAQGFRVQQRGETLTVWVNPKTSLPLSIEQKFRAGDFEVTTTLSDFVFDAKLDDALFSLELPAGYKLREE
jgi:outer membrane lipoprotein-sorting protein